MSLTKTVCSGAPVRLGYERVCDRPCTAVAAQVSIAKQPEHRTVSLVRSTRYAPYPRPRHRLAGQQRRLGMDLVEVFDDRGRLDQRLPGRQFARHARALLDLAATTSR